MIIFELPRSNSKNFLPKYSAFNYSNSSKENVYRSKQSNAKIPKFLIIILSHISSVRIKMEPFFLSLKISASVEVMTSEVIPKYFLKHLQLLWLAILLALHTYSLLAEQQPSKLTHTTLVETQHTCRWIRRSPGVKLGSKTAFKAKGTASQLTRGQRILSPRSWSANSAGNTCVSRVIWGWFFARLFPPTTFPLYTWLRWAREFV